MRLVYLCSDPGIPLCGDKGASVHLRSVARALADVGHRVTLACRRIDGQNPPPAGVRIEQLPESAPEQRDWLIDLARQEKAAGVLERYSLTSGPGLEAARRLDLRYVLEVNAPLVEEAARYRGLTLTDELLLRERRLLAAADAIVVVSEPLRRHAVAAGAAPHRVQVVPNGVDHSAFATAQGGPVRGHLGLDGQVVVGFAGSLKPWHGVPELVRAFAGLPDSASLLVVGDGPEREAVEATVEAAAVGDRVRLVGKVPHAEVPSYLRAMDIGVAPFERQASFYFSPLKVVEYLAAGLPVVATSQGELPELIGPAGVTVAPGSHAELAAALQRLVADDALRASLSRLAPRQVAERGWDRVAEQLETALVEEKVTA